MAVVPLLGGQGAKQAVDQLLLSACATIRETWPEPRTGRDCARVRRSRPIELGGFTVPHGRRRDGAGPHAHPRAVRQGRDLDRLGLPPCRGTGVVPSRQDETHITQLLGRMVRTPLARRVPGNDLLNSVECVLPHFDRSTAASVAQTMLGEREHDDDGTGGGAGPPRAPCPARHGPSTRRPPRRCGRRSTHCPRRPCRARPRARYGVCRRSPRHCRETV